eukprot:scpid106596/ scgid30753/ 
MLFSLCLVPILARGYPAASAPAQRPSEGRSSAMQQTTSHRQQAAAHLQISDTVSMATRPAQSRQPAPSTGARNPETENRSGANTMTTDTMDSTGSRGQSSLRVTFQDALQRALVMIMSPRTRC